MSLSPATAVTYRWRNDDTVLGVVPDERLALETNYELTIGSSAQAASGQAGLDETYVVPFTTVPFPGVRNTDAGKRHPRLSPRTGWRFHRIHRPNGLGDLC